MRNSRSDFVGGHPVLPGYGTTRLYLNKGALAVVATYPTTGATKRPGTENSSQADGPGVLTVNTSLGKTVNSPIFGALTSDAGPRTGQIGARVTF